MKGLPSNQRDASHGPLLDLLLGQIVPRLTQSTPPLASPKLRSSRAVGDRERQAPGPAAEPVGRAALAASGPERILDEDAVRRLFRLAVRDDWRAAASLVSEQQRLERSAEDLLLGLIQPVARALGRAWSSDELSFADVTVGVGLLQRLMNQVVDEAARTAPLPLAMTDESPRALFAALPGCKHRLGVQMLSALFGLSGWRSIVADDQSENSLLGYLREYQPTIFGLSLGSDFELDRGRDLILRVRHGNYRANTVIMIGGPAVLHFPDRARTLGADLVCGDASEALMSASRHLEERGIVSI